MSLFVPCLMGANTKKVFLTRSAGLGFFGFTQPRKREETIALAIYLFVLLCKSYNKIWQTGCKESETKLDAVACMTRQHKSVGLDFIARSSLNFC